jgi:hypothetical protein
VSFQIPFLSCYKEAIMFLENVLHFYGWCWLYGKLDIIFEKLVLSFTRALFDGYS